MEKEPWQVYFDLYREAYESDGEAAAVGRAFANTLYDLERRRIPQPVEIVSRFKLVVDEWHQADGHNWDALRRDLRNDWTDWRLG